MLCSQSGSRLATQPRASQADHLGEHLFWLGHVDQQGACVHDVKRVFLKAGVAGVGGHDLDAVEATFGNEFSRHLDVSGVAVEPDHAPAGENPAVEQLEDPAWPAAEIDRAVTGPQLDSIEQRLALRRQLLGLPQQTLALAAAASQAIDRVRLDRNLASRRRILRHRPSGSCLLRTELRLRHHPTPR